MNDLLEIGEEVLVNEKIESISIDSEIVNNPFHVVAKAIIHMPQTEMPVNHHFVPGFYLREFHVPKGTFVLSRVHKTYHCFNLVKGVASIWSPEKGWHLLAAPFSGFTLPYQQRAAVVHEDMIWTTSHPTEKTDLDEIEKDLFDDEVNPLLTEEENVMLKEITNFHWNARPANQLEDSE